MRLRSLTVLVASCCSVALSISATERPNIILIYSDDQGWGDVGYHGVADILTPAIDRIANEGVAFTQGYASASVCGPSRCGLLTGVYQQRFGCGENASMAGFPDETKWPTSGIPTSQSTLSDMLNDAGYTCGMVGKWHVGHSDEQVPNARGYDSFFGFLNGSHDYTRWESEFGPNRSLWPLFRNREALPAQEDTYLTDRFSNEAVEFIEQASKKEAPFFLYLAYNAVHHPWQVPDAYLERTQHLTDNPERNFFAAMILAMDDGIGRVLETLDAKGITENTIVWFMSDNGSPSGQGLKPSRERKQHFATLTHGEGHATMSNTGGLRGFKGDTYEGGIRVPMCMRWPSQVPAGTVYQQPVSNLDIVPTSLAPLGINKPTTGVHFDGVDLLPFLRGERDEQRPHETLYWRRDNDYAIRHGDWKLTWNDASGPLTIMLFNLANDPEERVDLIDQYPERAQALQDLFDAWDHTLPTSELWGAPWNRNRDYPNGTRIRVVEFNADPPTQHTARKKIKASN